MSIKKSNWPPIHLQNFQFIHFKIILLTLLASVSNIISSIESCIPYGRPLLLTMEDQLVEKGLYNPESDNETSVLALEQAILEVGSNLNVAQGVFYMLPIYSNGKLFVRYVKQIQSINPQPINPQTASK